MILDRRRLSAQSRAINFAGRELLVTSGAYEGYRAVIVGYEDGDFIGRLTFVPPHGTHPGWRPARYDSGRPPPGTWLYPIEEGLGHLYLPADRCVIEGEPGWEEPTA